MRRYIIVILLLLPLLLAWLDFDFDHRHQPLLMLDQLGGWHYDRGALVQAGTGHVFLELPSLYEGEKLLYVEARYRGGPGHTADPVGEGIDTPVLEIYHVDRDGLETKLCWGQSSPYQTPTDYEQPHTIIASGCGHTVDPAHGRIIARWTGEWTSGWYEDFPPDYQPGGTILSIKTVTY